MNSACASCCNRNGPCSLIGNLRRHWNIARYEPSTTPLGGEILIIKQTAETLGVATSTIHRRLNDGIIAGERPTPGRSPTVYVRASRNRRPKEISTCIKRCAFPGRLCGSVSSTARSKPSMSSKDVRKARATASFAHNTTSSTKPHKQGCSMNHDPNTCVCRHRAPSAVVAP
jgi:hypothetical protein